MQPRRDGADADATDAADAADKAVAWPFDPTHDRRAGLGYVTVAVGRDYGDIAPTSGTYTASYPGQLSARKCVDLTSVEYGPAEPLDE